MSTSEENLQIKSYFKHVSVETFIKYFFVFKKNKNIRSNSLIYNAFSENNEDWTKKSFVSRASKSKKIFKEKLEILALEYIVNEGNKVEEQYRTNAAKILNLYQLAKKNIIEQTEDENSDSAGKLVSKNLFNSEDLLFTSEAKFVKFFINLLVFSHLLTILLIIIYWRM
jgi:hypothetical protein